MFVAIISFRVDALGSIDFYGQLFVVTSMVHYYG